MVVCVFLFIAHSLNSDFIQRVYTEVEYVLTDNSTEFLLTHTEKNMDYLQGEITNSMYFSDADKILNEISKFLKDTSTDAIYVKDSDGELLANISKYNDKNTHSLFTQTNTLL